MSAAERIHRLAQNVERAESVRAVKRVGGTYAQYSQFGLWADMVGTVRWTTLQLSYGKENARGREAIENYFVTTFGEGTYGLKPGGPAHADGAAAAHQRLRPTARARRAAGGSSR